MDLIQEESNNIDYCMPIKRSVYTDIYNQECQMSRYCDGKFECYIGEFEYD